jgi:hypothetical protein
MHKIRWLIKSFSYCYHSYLFLLSGEQRIEILILFFSLQFDNRVSIWPCQWNIAVDFSRNAGLLLLEVRNLPHLNLTFYE